MDLLNIGAFATATGLTIPALRHYDDIGLITPAQVDPESGYRRYRHDQLDQARLVCSLRTMGVPIDEIRSMLTTPIRPHLDLHRERLVTQLRELTQQLAAVDEYLDKGTLTPPPQSVRPVQLRIAVDDIAAAAKFYTAAFDVVFLAEISSLQFGAFRTDRFFLLTLETRELTAEYRDPTPEKRQLVEAERSGSTRFGLLVDDVDAAHGRALRAGATEVHPPQEFTFKPRTGCVRDPYGNVIDLSQGSDPATLQVMSDTTCHMSISLDGFAAGPEQSLDNPLGLRGKELHLWHMGDPRATEADKIASGWLMRPRGAYVMGRNMFGPIRGDWDEEWTGWWGAEPPYHAPVFVLTRYAHDPIPMEGGTTFHFVTGGFDAAYAAALEAAGGKGVDIAGGASTVRQALAAGVIDELTVDIAPVLLGSGERIFDGVDFPFEPVEVLHSPLSTHIRYRRIPK